MRRRSPKPRGPRRARSRLEPSRLLRKVADRIVPAFRTSPASGRSNPARIRSSEVLPAQLGRPARGERHAGSSTKVPRREPAAEASLDAVEGESWLEAGHSSESRRPGRCRSRRPTPSPIFAPHAKPRRRGALTAGLAAPRLRAETPCTRWRSAERPGRVHIPIRAAHPAVCSFDASWAGPRLLSFRLVPRAGAGDPASSRTVAAAPDLEVTADRLRPGATSWTLEIPHSRAREPVEGTVSVTGSRTLRDRRRAR